MRRFGVPVPTRELAPDPTPRVIGTLLGCGCCVRVLCPWCRRYHYHRARSGYRTPDCREGWLAGCYELVIHDGPEAFPDVATRCVSGRHLTWYGPSLLEAPDVLTAQLR